MKFESQSVNCDGDCRQTVWAIILFPQISLGLSLTSSNHLTATVGEQISCKQDIIKTDLTKHETYNYIVKDYLMKFWLSLKCSNFKIMNFLYMNMNQLNMFFYLSKLVSPLRSAVLLTIVCLCSQILISS